MKAITFAVVLTAVAGIGLLQATPAAAATLNIPAYCSDLTVLPGGAVRFCNSLFRAQARLDFAAQQRATRAAQAAARLDRLQALRLARQQMACRRAASLGHTIPAYCSGIAY